jgi:hypothetical protein
MRWIKVIAVAVLLLLVVGLVLLWRGPLATLRTLQQVDDYPLYVMHYQGTYLFDWYLTQGADSPIMQFLMRMNASKLCTTFTGRTPDGDVLMGRNFDWDPHPALLLYTDPPGGHASVSMVDMYYLGYDGPERSWLQRIALLFSPYVIVDGMNEYGVAASSLKVPCRPGSGDSDKTAIISNHVMRLALDYARDVEEALVLLRDYDVAFPAACVHFFLADATGRSVIIEYIGGEPVVIENVEPWQVVTNFLVSEEQPQGNSSPCWRYNVAYQQLALTNGAVTAPQAMAIAAAASVPETNWSAVYNLTDGGVDVAVGGNYDRVHHFTLPMGR